MGRKGLLAKCVVTNAGEVRKADGRANLLGWLELGSALLSGNTMQGL